MSVISRCLIAGAMAVAAFGCHRVIDGTRLVSTNVCNALLILLVVSVLAGIVTFFMIPYVGAAFVKANLSGRDLLKQKPTVLPESLGLAAASIYLVVLFLLIPVPFLSQPDDSNETTLFSAHHTKLGDMLSALLSLQSMALLGFADDVFDIRWRHKLLLPCIASIPLLAVYYESGGATAVVIPQPFQALLGRLIDLGPFYYMYMGMMSIFCTNAINILAGINGVEVGQSVVIAISIALNDYLHLGDADPMAVNAHLFSLHFLLPFIGVSCALLWHNWFPARVFVGDTYCYFAGMTFAVVSILGHFSKTALLFFIPQLCNFAYSIPQLFHLVHCPRHRMPTLNVSTGLLEPSEAELENLGTTSRLIIEVYDRLGLVRVTRAHQITLDAATQPSMSWLTTQMQLQDPNRPVKTTNFTLLNFMLVRFGPMREDRLCASILLFQVVGSMLAFWIRYRLVFLFYDQVQP